MSQLFLIFLNNLVPIFLMAGSGYLLGHLKRVEPRSLSQVIFYILSPCLLFTLLTTSRLSGTEVVQVMGMAASVISLSGLAAYLVGRALRLERRMLAALVLVSMFINAGNYGLPVVLFAFGEAALSFAALYFAMSAIMAYTVGTLIASAGSLGLWASLRNLFRIPILYALALAALFVQTGWPIPAFLSRTTGLLGDAALPAMLVLLGLQLRGVAWVQYRRPIAAAVGVRLLVSPLLALALAPWIGLSGVAYQAAVLESGMPTAVLTTMLASEFDAEPGFVSAAVFITTVLSPLSLTPLLYYLGA